MRIFSIKKGRIILPVVFFCLAGIFVFLADNVSAATYEDTFTSQVIDNHHNTVDYGTMSWDATVNSPTTSIVVEIRAGNATNTSDSSWTGWNTIAASGDAIPSSFDGHRYFQYRITLGTNDLSETPTIRSITHTTNSSALYSSYYNTNDSRNVMEDLDWLESLNGGEVVFQIRTSPDGSTWSNWCGPEDGGSGCETESWFTAYSGTESIDSMFADFYDDRYFQYKTVLMSEAVGGSARPEVSEVNMEYTAPDDAPRTYEDTFTSQIIDNHYPCDYGVITWDDDIPADTSIRNVQARAGNSASTSDPSWSAWTDITNGQTLDSPFDGKRYFQYHLTLGTDDLSKTPTLYSLTYERNISTLVSSPYDANDDKNATRDLTWLESFSGTETEDDVLFQLRTASDPISGWSDWCGPDDGTGGCSTESWFTAAGGAEEIDEYFRDTNNDRHFQYKAILKSSQALASADTPEISEVNLTYENPPYAVRDYEDSFTKILDNQYPADYGTSTWNANIPPNTSMRPFVRSLERQIIYEKDFEDENLADWSITPNDGCSQSSVTNSADCTYDSPAICPAPSGSYFLQIAGDDKGVSPSITNLNDYRQVRLEVKIASQSMDNDGENTLLQISSDGGNIWQTLKSIHNVPMIGNVPEFGAGLNSYTFDVDNFKSNNFKIRIGNEPDGGNGCWDFAYIDDVKITGLAPSTSWIPFWDENERDYVDLGNDDYQGTWEASDFYPLDGSRYLEYKIILGTDDLSLTPVFKDITFTHNVSTYLISSIYNSNFSNNVIEDLTWLENLNGGDVAFQLRTSPDGASWTDWLGPDDGSGVSPYETYYTTPSGSEIYRMSSDHIDDQYFQYKTILASNEVGGSGIPEVSEVNVEYGPATYVPRSYESTFTSRVMDAHHPADFGVIDWVATIPTSTSIRQFEVRAGNVSTPDGSWTDWQWVTSGQNLPDILDGNRYIQYHLILGTDDLSKTPELDKVTIQTNVSALVSSPFDTGDSRAWIENLTWDETIVGTSSVYFQLRTSPDNSTWSSWCGPEAEGEDSTTSCETEEFYSNPTATQSIDSMFTDMANDRYMQYKAILKANKVGGENKPRVSQVEMDYRLPHDVRRNYESTFTSRVLDAHHPADFGTIDWVTEIPPDTSISIRAKAGDNRNPDSWSMDYIDFAKGDSIDQFDGHRYVQYQAILGTDDLTKTPELDKVIFTTNVSALISSPFNTKDSNSRLEEISWTESFSGASDGSQDNVVYQVRTAPRNNPSDWTNWCGPDDGVEGSCDTESFFSSPDGSDPIDEFFSTGNNDQYMQYKAILMADELGGSLTPTVSDTVLKYNNPGNSPRIYESTFTSRILDAHHPADFGTFRWVGLIRPETSIRQFEVRAGNYFTPDSTWTTWQHLQNWDSLDAFDGNRYIQYRVILGTDDLSVTPELDKVMFSNNVSALISSPFNAKDRRNVITDLKWQESKSGGSDVAYQLRTSPDNSDWSDWCGPGNSAYTQLSDDFDGLEMDPKWNYGTLIEEPNSYAEKIPGEVRFALDGDGSYPDPEDGNYKWARIYNHEDIYPGDFDVSINFNDINMPIPPEAVNYLRLYVRGFNGYEGAYVQLRSENWNSSSQGWRYQVVSVNEVGSTTHKITNYLTESDEGGLRLKRVGSTFYGYYQEDGNWKLIGSLNNDRTWSGGINYNMVVMYSHRDAANDINIDIDDFSFTGGCRETFYSDPSGVNEAITPLFSDKSSDQYMQYKAILMADQVEGEQLPSVFSTTLEYGPSLRAPRTYESIFTSRRFPLPYDFEFKDIYWKENIPPDTSINVEVRFKDEEDDPDTEFTDWINIHKSGWEDATSTDPDKLGKQVPEKYDYNKIVQYRVILGTDDLSRTPEFDRFEIEYLGGHLVSSGFDSGTNNNNIVGFSWTEEYQGDYEDEIAFGLRTASHYSNLEGEEWQTVGTTSQDGGVRNNCSAEDLGGGQRKISCGLEAMSEDLKDNENNQYMQYQLYFITPGVQGRSDSTFPVISKINLDYLQNVPPEFGTVNSTQQTIFQEEPGKVKIDYQIKDDDLDPDTSQTYLTPYFHYSLDGGSSWTEMNSDALSHSTSQGDITDENGDGILDLEVNASDYTTYSTYWDVKEELSNFSDTATNLDVGEAGTFTTSDGNWVTVNFDGSYTSPVVVGTTNSHEDEAREGDPGLVFEVKNVTSNSAEMRVCNSDAVAGTGCEAFSNEETVGYVVLDASALGGIDGIEAGTFTASSSIDDYQKLVSFSNSFSQAPAVFLTVDRQREGDGPVEAWIDNITAGQGYITSTEFRAGICEQNSEDGCDSGHGNEAVNWVAVEPGTGIFNSPSIVQNKDGTIPSSEWTAIDYSSLNFTQDPVVLFEVQDDEGGQDPKIDEIRNLTQTDAEVRYCELDPPDADNTNDHCDGHMDMSYAWLAVEPGPLTISKFTNESVQIRITLDDREDLFNRATTTDSVGIDITDPELVSSPPIEMSNLDVGDDYTTADITLSGFSDDSPLYKKDGFDQFLSDASSYEFFDGSGSTENIRLQTNPDMYYARVTDLYNNGLGVMGVSSGHNIMGYAHDSNLSGNDFADFSCYNLGCTPTSTFGVTIDRYSLNLSGYASTSDGWISFESSEIPPGGHSAFNSNCINTCNGSSNPPCTACYNPNDNQVYGWARLNEEWIELSHGGDDMYLNPQDKEFEGYGLRDGAYNLYFNHDTEGNNLEDPLEEEYRVYLVNQSAPTTSALRTVMPSIDDLCARDKFARNVTLEWDMEDSDPIDRHMGYEVIIDTDGDSADPLINQEGSSTAEVMGGSLPLGSDDLDYNTSYYWWIRTRDSFGLMSEWVKFDSSNSTHEILNEDFSDGNSQTFTTYKHEFPQPYFDWIPEDINQNTEIYFTATSSEIWTSSNPAGDPSPFSESLYQDLTWDTNYPDKVNIYSSSTPTTTVKFRYTSSTPSDVILEITDNDDYTCATSTEFNVEVLPIWKEVKTEDQEE